METAQPAAALDLPKRHAIPAHANRDTHARTHARTHPSKGPQKTKVSSRSASSFRPMSCATSCFAHSTHAGGADGADGAAVPLLLWMGVNICVWVCECIGF